LHGAPAATCSLRRRWSYGLRVAEPVSGASTGVELDFMAGVDLWKWDNSSGWILEREWNQKFQVAGGVVGTLLLHGLAVGVLLLGVVDVVGGDLGLNLNPIFRRSRGWIGHLLAWDSAAVMDSPCQYNTLLPTPALAGNRGKCRGNRLSGMEVRVRSVDLRTNPVCTDTACDERIPHP
jgi:hypothetical protein